MNYIQIFRRIGQQMTGMQSAFSSQTAQFQLIEKLYLKNRLVIKMTCSAMPEQYEVFKDGNQVAYFRLRHGEFRVDYPSCGGETIFEANPSGDGIFEDNERLVFLTKAMRKVIKKLSSLSTEADTNK